MKETPYELLEDKQKKYLGKNNEAKMTLYNALLFKNCKIDLLTQEYGKFSISNKETIDNGFTRFNVIEKAKVTAIKEAKDLATLPLDELVSNLKVYGMILKNNGVVSKTTTKEMVKSFALKAKVTREKTSNDSDSQEGSDEDVDEQEAKAFKLMARNFLGPSNGFGEKGGESSKQKGVCYNYGIEVHFPSDCRKPNENKAFVGGAWSDSEDGNELQNDIICFMAIES
ncbi:hypothetical protein Tco_1353361 [Tanacetum coccineum]